MHLATLQNDVNMIQKNIFKVILLSKKNWNYTGIHLSLIYFEMSPEGSIIKKTLM